MLFTRDAPRGSTYERIARRSEHSAPEAPLRREEHNQTGSQFNLEQTLESARDAGRQLAQESTRAAEFMELLIPEPTGASNSTGLDADGAAGWFTGIGANFEPLASDVGRSVSFLLQIVSDATPPAT